MQSNIFERLKHSTPAAFWFYTRVPFLVFLLGESFVIYIIFRVGQQLMAPESK